MSAEEKYRKFAAFKEKVWREIKQLEQEYKRNATRMNELTESQSDISARVQILLAKIDKKGEEYDSYCYENKVGEFAEVKGPSVFELKAIAKDKLSTFERRLAKLNIKVELGLNYPWVYLDAVNGNKVSEKFKSEFGFTLAFYPIKRGQTLSFTDTKEIFRIIRKYSFYNARIFGGKAL